MRPADPVAWAMRRLSSRQVLLGAVILAALVLLLLFTWDYIWINLIRSGNVESP